MKSDEQHRVWNYILSSGVVGICLFVILHVRTVDQGIAEAVARVRVITEIQRTTSDIQNRKEERAKALRERVYPMTNWDEVVKVHPESIRQVKFTDRTSAICDSAVRGNATLLTECPPEHMSCDTIRTAARSLGFGIWELLDKKGITPEKLSVSCGISLLP